MNETKTRGWSWPLNSKKAHYFVDARSLCDSWMFLGSSLEDDKHNSPDNCKACMKKREKNYAQTPRPGQ